MTVSFSECIREVGGYFENGDYHLGYRRLLDAAIETDNYEVYEQVLRFCDWYDTAEEKNKGNPSLYEKVKDVLVIIENGYHAPSKEQPDVKLIAQKISKKYARGSFSLSAMDVVLPVSRIIGLVGENGNGKTTLLRLLHGELKPDEGTITYRFSNPFIRSFYDTK